jgi:tRNA-specific 2-thiouridylase
MAFPPAKPESMEICFVPDGDYAGFVERVAGPQPAGTVVDGRGQVLARHGGIHRFTVGQRRGLGVSSAEPLYVQRIEAGAGAVVVGPATGLERSEFTVLQPSWVQGTPSPRSSSRFASGIAMPGPGPRRRRGPSAHHRAHRGAGARGHPRTGCGVLPG